MVLICDSFKYPPSSTYDNELGACLISFFHVHIHALYLSHLLGLETMASHLVHSIQGERGFSELMSAIKF